MPPGLRLLHPGHLLSGGPLQVFLLVMRRYIDQGLPGGRVGQLLQGQSPEVLVLVLFRDLFHCFLFSMIQKLVQGSSAIVLLLVLQGSPPQDPFRLFVGEFLQGLAPVEGVFVLQCRLFDGFPRICFFQPVQRPAAGFHFGIIQGKSFHRLALLRQRKLFHGKDTVVLFLILRGGVKKGLPAVRISQFPECFPSDRPVQVAERCP